jgi:hypothetical protein
MTSTTADLKLRAQPRQRAKAKSQDRRDLGILLLMSAVPYAAALLITAIIQLA